MEITIYSKNGTALATVVAGSSSYVFTQIQGDNYLQLEFKHDSYIDIRRNAYVVYNDVKYTLLSAVKPTKISTTEYEYTMRLEAPQELLDCFIMSHMAGEGQNLTKAYERNFSLMGTAREHLEMLLLNCDVKSPVSFKIGSVDKMLIGEKLVAYNYTSGKSALQLIANAFECEWWVDGSETDGYTVNLGKCSFSEGRPTRLAYGYDNGIMPSASRELHKDAERMTHICVQGGTKNINTLSQLTDKQGNPISPYGFNTLHLPRLENADDTGVGTIRYDVKNGIFEGENGFNADYSVMLTIDRNANTMTSSLFNTDEDVIVEKAYDMSTFYPQAKRNVTAFSFQRNNTEFYIEDSHIEEACDYKAYQLGGEKMTVEFQSGALAGKSFDVINYDHSKKRFECSLADYDTISMPSVDEELWRPSVDDEFIVFGCALPVSYLHNTEGDTFTGAEWDMCRRTASILCDNFEDKFAYRFTIDSNWLSRRTASERKRLKVGYWVHYVDNELCGGGVDIRISEVKTYLNKPNQPELTVGDEVKTLSVSQKLQQIQSSVSATHNYVQSVEQNAQQAIQQIEKGGVEQVQADWSETSESSKAYIKHKPTVDKSVPTSPSHDHIPSSKTMSDWLDDYVSIEGFQRIEGTKVFTGEIVVKARENSYPAFGFQDSTGEPVGSMEMTSNGMMSVYIASTASGYFIPAIDERGDESHPVYVDANGKTKRCNVELISPTANVSKTGRTATITITDKWGTTQVEVRDGKDGRDGAGVSIKGSYNTYAELISAHPYGELGDAYIVGQDLYVWGGSAWNNVGQIKGDKGDKGDDAIPLIDKSFPQDGSASDERTPSTKLVWDTFVDIIQQLFARPTSEYVNDHFYKTDYIDANFYTKTYITDNYYTKGMVDAGFTLLRGEIPTTQTITDWGFTKNKGTVTSVGIMMNGVVKGTVTSSGTINLGTVLTQHQSLSSYAKKTDIPTNVSAFTNDAGYLKQHQSLAEYAKKSELPTKETVKGWGFVNRRFVTFHRTYNGAGGWLFNIVNQRGCTTESKIYNGRTGNLVLDGVTTEEQVNDIIKSSSFRAFHVRKADKKYRELPVVEVFASQIVISDVWKWCVQIILTSGNTPLPYQEEEVDITYVIDAL